jgi:hypothetical protein
MEFRNSGKCAKTLAAVVYATGSAAAQDAVVGGPFRNDFTGIHSVAQLRQEQPNMAENLSVSSTEPEPGYSETDIAKFIEDPRLLAGTHAYAHDKISIGQVMEIARSSPQDILLPTWFKSDVLAYSRMIHEIARRIISGRIPATERIYEKHPDVRARFGRPTPNYYSPYKFSELEGMPPELNPIAARRERFDEADIQEILKEPRMLACLDAYCQGITTLRETQRRMFGNAHYLPRSLSQTALLHLAFEVCERIKSGRIVVPATFRDQYGFAYSPPGNYSDTLRISPTAN